MKNQTTTQTEPTGGVIALRAYEIWKTNGCPEGHDLEHWLQAEAELREAGRHNIPRVVVSLNANPSPRAVRSTEPVKPQPQPARLPGRRLEPVH
jgi:Protein of unknown function (DUF2934)